MYIYNIVVRWANGDLEGFGASALEKEQAYKRAVDKAEAKSKYHLRNGAYAVLSKADYDALSIEEQDQVQADWDSETL